jgi:hypothetical protein
MKLTGEYQTTENGVVIEGRIHDTHIAEVRDAALKNCPGFVILNSSVDPALAINARQHGLRALGSQWFHAYHSMGKLDGEKVIKALDVPTRYRRCASMQPLIQLASIGVDGMSGIMYQKNLRWRDLDYRAHNARPKILNCSWVFSATQDDGSFKVQLYGLVNRHIMTMLISAATKYAKLLDLPEVIKLVQQRMED